MDDREFEALLSRRLHDRFDAAQASDKLRDAVVGSMTGQVIKTSSRTRSMLIALPRYLLAVAAVILVVAIIALGGRGPIGAPGTSPTPLPTGIASATPTASATPAATPTPGPTQPAGTVPPVSTAAWTGLEVHALAGAPEISMLIPWSGGYVGIGQANATAPVTAWTSFDGRTWAAIPDATFGLNAATNVTVDGGTACGTGVLIATVDGSGAGSLWASRDGVIWSHGPRPGGSVVASMTGGLGGAVITTAGGPIIEFTRDCSSWQAVTLSGPSSTQVRAVAAFGDGYVAVGYSGQGTGVRPLAWWSHDGQQWSPATVQKEPGDGFLGLLAGRTGLVAISSQPGFMPGTASFWSSTDGHSWVTSGADPFGRIAAGEGVGGAAGGFIGDGTRLFGYGTKGAGAGPTQYWLSTDGQHWTKLTLTGSGPDSSASYFQAFLVRDGILFSSATGTWFGNPLPK